MKLWYCMFFNSLCFWFKNFKFVFFSNFLLMCFLVNNIINDKHTETIVLDINSAWYCHIFFKLCCYYLYSDLSNLKCHFITMPGVAQWTSRGPFSKICSSWWILIILRGAAENVKKIFKKCSKKISWNFFLPNFFEWLKKIKIKFLMFSIFSFFR